MQIGPKRVDIAGRMLTVGTVHDTDSAFFIHDHDLTAICGTENFLMVGDLQGHVLSLEARKGDAPWEIAKGGDGMAETGTNAQEVCCRAIAVRGLHGALTLVVLSPVIMILTRWEKLNMGPHLAVKSCTVFNRFFLSNLTNWQHDRFFTVSPPAPSTCVRFLPKRTIL